jgi:hypothetical protein
MTDAIDMAEDRKLFREAMHRIGLETPKSVLANASDVKNDDKLKYRASIEQIEARGSDPNQIAKPKAEFDRAAGAAEEPERRKRYQEKALIEALEALQVGGVARHHPALLHAWRNRRRHCLQQGRVHRDHRARPGLAASPTSLKF